MTTRKTTGFTIIEVMLFLGITGLIMAFMLSGVGAQLNQRRYQDATNSLVGYFQGQYSLAANVNNSREQSASFGTCDTTGVAGTSDCTIVGRIIHGGAASGGDTETLTSTWVIATVDVATLSSDDADSSVLQDAGLVAAAELDQYNSQWGTRLVQAESHDLPLTFTMLIVRVPTTGIIRTYINTGIDRTPQVIVSASDNITGDFKLCVDPVGLLGSSVDPAGVLIERGTSSTSGVKFVSQGDCV